jgi:hypothetical protein
MTRKPYDSDCSDPEWEFVAPYVTLMSEDAPQRNYGYSRDTCKNRT